jgi:glycosyltransferase involved in cell wall biosynthesis
MHNQTFTLGGETDPGTCAVKRRRALFVAYAFPPTGGVSVQRVTKFIKYLPDHGWDCSVLTAQNASVPMVDESLLGEIPEGTIIRRARTLEPSYGLKSMVAASRSSPPQDRVGRVKNKARDVARRAFNFVLQPDPQILWRPQALREGMRLLKDVPHDVIVASGPPFSSFLLAETLSRRTGIPLAVDYRDEWTVMTYWENKQIGLFESFVQRRMQSRVLKRAGLVLGTTPSSADELTRVASDSGGHGKVEYVYNGFDADDYPAPVRGHAPAEPDKDPQRFRLAFVGTLWNLTTIGPVVDAMIALANRNPDLARKLELVVAGRRTSQQEAELDRLTSTAITLQRLPFIAHKEAIDLMCQSDALLLINADLPNTDRLINAKTFEYMAARRPIFVVGPEGELWRLLSALPGTLLARPGDTDALVANLETAIRRWQDGATFDMKEWDITSFERRRLAGRLAGFLDTLATTGAR